MFSLSSQPPWQLSSEEEGWYQPDVIVRFNRECREWPQGAAEAACQELFEELGQEGILIIATDGSFTPGSMRAGWGFAAFLDGVLIAEKSGASTLYTSSTRMELEAVRQALGWLVQESLDVKIIVFATDSMAVLQKIKKGWLPDGWREAELYLSDKSPTFTYVPGHAGVKYNEKADQLAAAAEPTDKLSLFPQDIILLCQYSARQGINESLRHSDEGDRLLHLGIPFANSRDSHHKGPDRCHRNQLLTGNIAPTTLNLLLSGRVREERVSDMWITPSRTPTIVNK